jgi:hypothetical protein
VLLCHNSGFRVFQVCGRGEQRWVRAECHGGVSDHGSVRQARPGQAVGNRPRHQGLPPGVTGSRGHGVISTTSSPRSICGEPSASPRPSSRSSDGPKVSCSKLHATCFESDRHTDYLSIYLSIYLYIYISIYLYIYLSIYM